MVTNVTANNSKINWKELAAALDPEIVRDTIIRETRAWGFSLLVIGFVQLIGHNFLDPVWGVLLILIGAASFSFRSAAMLPIYGVTLAWAMITNILSGEWRWALFGLLQAYWAFTTFRQFLILRRVAGRLGIGLCADGSVRDDRCAGIFPWAGCALSAVAPIGLVTLLLVGGISYALTEQIPSEQAINLTFAALMDSACLGLALGLASLMARFRWREVSILAVIGGALMLGLDLLLMLL